MSENEGNKRTLTPAQRRAIAALLENRNVKTAAEAAKVAESTLHRWLADDAFVTELRHREGQMLDDAVRRLVWGQQMAIQTIYSLMVDKEVGPSIRLRAAQTVIDQMVKLREIRNTEERLEAMERALAGMGVSL